MKIGGIDEAGRGPAIGPLVVATVVVDEKNIEKLRNIGVKDSKQLTPHERKNLFSQITSIADDF